MMKIIQRGAHLALAVAFVVVAIIASSQLVAAQGGSTAVTQNDVNVVAKELWCPLCSGVRLDACELRACDQMKDVIADKLAAGEDTQAIKAYFVAQYGPQVLGEPPREGFNWLAWILPVVVVVGGGAFVWYRARGMMRRPGGAASPAAKSPTPTQPAQDYETKLDEELKRYD
jgi:cytochrome c-type biogenesis protein CcmH